jgi:hypothetical protein
MRIQRGNQDFHLATILDAREASWRRAVIIARLYQDGSMTAVEVLFRYGTPPGEMEMGALGQVSDVYGIRQVRFNPPERTVRVEYDATRLNESTVEKLLRCAGLDIRERLALS